MTRGARASRRARVRAPARAVSAGIIRNRSGSISGVGPASGDKWRGGHSASLRGRGAGDVTFGPGVDVSFPNDPYLIPFLVPEERRQPDGRQAPTLRRPPTC